MGIDVVPDAADLIGTLPAGGIVIDCGCFGWRLGKACAEAGHRLIGLDQKEPPGRPEKADFALIVDGEFTLGDDVADLVVASHIIEHIATPVSFFAEIARVTSPGGLIWIEAPSELAAMVRSSDNPSEHGFENFWDDPTHVRPWSPAALYRLALSCKCFPLAVERGKAGGIPVARLLAQKPLDLRGRPQTKYVSLQGIPPHPEKAWAAIWG